LVGQGGLADRVGEIEAELRAIEESSTRLDYVAGKAGARRGLSADELVAPEAASEGVEDTAFKEVAVDFGEVVVVVTLGYVVKEVDGLALEAAFVFEVEAARNVTCGVK